MADAPAADGGGKMGFLGRKIGPLPVWAWGLIGFGGYYWWTHYGPGATSSSASTDATGQPLGNPEVVVVQGPRGQRGPSGGKKKKAKVTPRKAAPVTGGRFQAAPAGAGVATPPGQVATPQGPVYDAWQPDSGVAEPQQVYAPMTAGSVYG